MVINHLLNGMILQVVGPLDSHEDLPPKSLSTIWPTINAILGGIYRDPDYNPDIKGYSYNLVFNNLKGSFDIKVITWLIDFNHFFKSYPYNLIYKSIIQIYPGVSSLLR